MAITINGTTGVAGVAGSASTPALQGTDSNTGVFYPAADVVALGTNGTEAMRVDSSQNVGIGVTPASFATVKALQLNTASTVMAFTNELDIAQNVYYNAGNKYITTGAATMYAQTGGQHQWFNATSGTAGNAISFTQAMTLDSSGNLLVGTTNATGDGSGIEFQPSYQNGGFVGIKKTSSSVSGDRFTYFTRNGSVIGSITQSGTTAVAYNTSSDYRLKENVQPMTGALAKVSLLKPCTYKWKVDGSDGEGFIAHELAEICPSAVTGTKDAVETYIDAEGKEQTRPVYQGIDTSFLVATLTAAIQELKAELDSVKAELATLKGAQA